MRGDEKMYESTFCENNRKALRELYDNSYDYQLLSKLRDDTISASAVNTVSDEFKLDTALCSDPVRDAEREEQFVRAERWLNHLGIKTRTEYGNLLPTYNLFLEIGEYLQRRRTEENDE
jgi:hypothetical protein